MPFVPERITAVGSHDSLLPRLPRARRVNIAAAFAIFLGFHPQLEATVILHDKGIQMAGPFETPDVHHPPTASSEATFLAGSISTAPLYLNEFLLNSSGSGGLFSNNGWVNGDVFNVESMAGGRILSLTWDLSGTPYAITHISVNFDNNFYHVYTINSAQENHAALFLTGNQRDVVSHVRFFGDRVPDIASTGLLLCVGLIGIAAFRLKVFSQHC